MAGEDQQPDPRTPDDPEPGPDQATSVHPTAAHPTDRPEDATRRHEIPATPAPWQPPPGNPASPWGAGPHTGGMAPVPPGPAIGPAFGTAPVTGGAGPWMPPGTAPFTGQQPGYGPQGYGAPGYGPLTGPGGPGGPPGPGGWGGQPWGPPPPPPPKRGSRRWLWVGIAAAVVLVLLVTTVLLTRQSSPSATLEATVADLGTREGVTYAGRVPDQAGGQSSLEITVDRAGNATGTVTRDAGGRAEFLITDTEQAVRGDRAWWEPATDRPELVDRLAGVWLSDARSQLPRDLDSWTVSPAELGGRLQPAGAQEQEGTEVDGREARVLTTGDTRATVVDDDPPTLVGLDQPSFGVGRASPVTVQRANPQALSALPGLVGQAPEMKSYFLAITERPRLQVAVEGAGGECNTPTCGVTVRLVNSGTLATSGTIVVSLNGAEVARHPFSSAPGSNLTFPTTADNPVYSNPGARITALWLARVEGGR